ncbi:BZ3500_MvSof-1268-A1-R1_Chr12-1g03676 [Microbotryum saponariae]|uniref:BZ3500_MvSof-1268-A1-R1_Chr12-1g03676 protein n=1 Tax=Microbotryum saponariae TaxID=289078 RepID=A0A2X0MS87_9BASI|nr:BZ3500_MvSof-1268-A1-R1_Chr12-1g03676 [Microbotryum saponariae]SDA05269.1 BZ3501_MvSof-1269-A2-R1_Chr12-1g03253 [Microbotryum saponariae]
MPGRHAASLVPKEEHSPALLRLLKSSLTDTIVEHVAQKAMSVIRCRDEPLNSSAESSTAPLPELDDFIRDICRKSRCHVPTLLCTLVYLDRLKDRLPVRSCGSPSTRHRVFVAALIVAAKYLNDSSPYNKHWVRYAGHFRLEEVNLMERQLLCLLDFDLRIGEPELIETFAPFLGPIEAGMAERLLRRQSRPLHQRAEASDSDSDFDSDGDDTSECEMDSDSDGDSHSSAPSSTISPSSSTLVAKTQEIQLTTSSASSESSYSPQAEHKDEEDDLLCGSSGGASRPVSWSSAGSASTIASSLDYSCHEESSSSPTYSPPTTRHVFVIPKQPSAMTTGSDLMQHLQRKLDFQSWMSSPGCGATSTKRNAVLISSRIGP